MNTLLEFSDVSREVEAGWSRCTLAVPAGALALLEVEPGAGGAAWADLASGLLAPDRGSVLFKGSDWASLEAGPAALARARIGRVFSGTAWISNLDVDENITLPLRYHGLMSDEESLREAGRLANRLGLPSLPSGRPAHASRAELRVAEWVRALLGPRDLVILEDPLRDIPRRGEDLLLGELERRRGDGLGVVWIEGAETGRARARLKPSLHFKVESGNFVRVNEHE